MDIADMAFEMAGGGVLERAVKAAEKRAVKGFMEWADSYCLKHAAGGYSGGNNRLHKECPQCWAEKWREVKNGQG